MRVSVVIPCLNEAETIAECVRQARGALDANGFAGEVIVVDNGSTDGSGELARSAGADVVEEPRRGYGSAYLAGLGAAQGDYVVMVDADLTYDFGEVPIALHPRVGESKLAPFRDGWRHLRLILVYNPTFLFIVPGLVMFTLGSVIALLVFLEVPVFGRNLLVHSLIFGCLLILIGVQAIGLGLSARACGVYFISDQDQLFQRVRGKLRLEHGLVVALLVLFAGL